MSTANLVRVLPSPLAVNLAVSGHLTQETRQTIERLAYALEHQHARCDAIGESGLQCFLRADHPGDIHQHSAWGVTRRFRLAGEAW